MRGVRTLLAAGCEPVVVVVGAAGAAVAAELAADAAVSGRCQPVINDGWGSGVGSSLRAGLSALDGRCGAVAITLVDQPELTAEAVRRVADAWRRGAPAAVATDAGEQAHPVVLDAALWRAVAANAVGERGARTLLRAHPELVIRVACDGAGSARDVDTALELHALARSIGADVGVRNQGARGAGTAHWN